MRRAVFLDRDGALCETAATARPGELQVSVRSVRALRRLNAAGFQTIVIAYPAGGARDDIDAWDVEDIHEALRERLAQGGARIDGIYRCPHLPEAGCACPKTGDGLFRRAEREMGVHLPSSYVIGDVENGRAARAVDATAVFLGESPAPGEPEHRAADLLDAVEWILERDPRGDRPPAVAVRERS